MNRYKYLDNEPLPPRTPYPECGQIWRFKDKDAYGPNTMLLDKPYEKGFHCIYLGGKGNISFNSLEHFFDQYEYVSDASEDIIRTIRDDYDKFEHSV